ncbi:MAG: acylphosphatase [Planctomycetes bacterium]|nr:acylphosphatase [Planctomycetota bacterium]
MKRAHLWISGRVQGVFFRAHTENEARRLGLTGWVKNIPDGRVETVFEGNDAAVDAMITWAHHGPPSARVTNVEIKWETPEGQSGEFTTVY